MKNALPRTALHRTALLFLAAFVLAPFEDGYLILLRVAVLAVGAVIIATPLIKQVVRDLIEENDKLPTAARRY